MFRENEIEGERPNMTLLTTCTTFNTPQRSQEPDFAILGRKDGMARPTSKNAVWTSNIYH